MIRIKELCEFFNGFPKFDDGEDVFIEYGVGNKSGGIYEKTFETKDEAIKYAKVNNFSCAYKIVYFGLKDVKIDRVWTNPKEF